MNSTTYRLQRQTSGALAVHSAAFGETMHPGGGPWREATRLYVQGCGLAALLREPAGAPAGADDALVLFDVGLGAAANALAALSCHAELQRQGRRPRPLHVISFEADPGGARFALAEAEALGYPRGHERALGDLLSDGHAEPGPGQRWTLRLGDFTRLIRDEPTRADVFFFDPFSPRANPEMWSLATLEALYGTRRRMGPARLATYSTAFGTRAGLLLAGFFVGEGPRDEHAQRGRGSTLAAGWFRGLEQPLSAAWLARWRHDREPWPPLTPPAQHRALRERLAEHPQWVHFSADATRTEPRSRPPARAEPRSRPPARAEPRSRPPARPRPGAAAGPKRAGSGAPTRKRAPAAQPRRRRKGR